LGTKKQIPKKGTARRIGREVFIHGKLAVGNWAEKVQGVFRNPEKKKIAGRRRIGAEKRRSI